MSFDFTDFRSLADLMVSSTPDMEAWEVLSAARIRSAVSRSYYHAHKLGVAFLLEHGSDPYIFVAQAMSASQVKREDVAKPLREKAFKISGSSDIHALEEEAAKDSHSRVIRLLRTFGKDGHEAAESLMILKTYRITADYNPYANWTENSFTVVKAELERSEKVFSKLAQQIKQVKGQMEGSK